MSRSDPYDAERDRLLDEPDLDAEQDRREFERLRWGLEGTDDE